MGYLGEWEKISQVWLIDWRHMFLGVSLGWKNWMEMVIEVSFKCFFRGISLDGETIVSLTLFQCFWSSHNSPNIASLVLISDHFEDDEKSHRQCLWTIPISIKWFLSSRINSHFRWSVQLMVHLMIGKRSFDWSRIRIRSAIGFFFFSQNETSQAHHNELDDILKGGFEWLWASTTILG